MDNLAIYSISLFIYNLSLIPVIFLSFIFYFFLLQSFVLNYRLRIKTKKNYFPFITIQIPVYNDIIAIRCIEKCLNFDYPKDRYEIIVIDDSDDKNVRKAIDFFKDKIKILRRNNREGFKAGALNYALKYSKGEIIVIFDSDEVPGRKFLREIAKYFSDKKIAMVQAKLKIYNSNQNLITKFASLLLSFYYNIVLPFFYKNGVYHCTGSGVAIRKDILLKFGGWNQKNVTEDADFSLKLILTKYKAIYLKNLEVKAEVPTNLKNFLRQQARWTFGLVRCFVENWSKIMFSKILTFKQKFLLVFQTFLSYFLGIFIIIFTFSGFFSFLFGEPRNPTLQDLTITLLTFFLTSGFLFSLFFISYKEKIEIKKELVFTLLTLGFLLVLNNTYYFFRAFFSDKFYWIVTPKSFSIPAKFLKKYNKEKKN